MAVAILGRASYTDNPQNEFSGMLFPK